MSIPRKVGYSVLSVDGTETSISDVESLATTEADSWDEVARPAADRPKTPIARPDDEESFASISNEDEVCGLLSSIHIAIRRLVQQQTAILDALKLTYKDTTDHQKEALVRLKRISRNTQQYGYPPGECEE